MHYLLYYYFSDDRVVLKCCGRRRKYMIVQPAKTSGVNDQSLTDKHFSNMYSMFFDVHSQKRPVLLSVSLWWPRDASLEGVSVEQSESSLWIKQNLKYS